MESSFFGSPEGRRELTEILRVIDDQLACDPLASSGSDADAARSASTWPPESYELSERLNAMRATHAPLFVPTGRDWRSLVKRFLNVPIRVFGRRQLHFNGLLVDVLGLLLAELRALRGHVEPLREELRLLRAELEHGRALQDWLRSRVEDLAAEDVRLGLVLHEEANRLAGEQASQRGHVERLEASLQGQSAWITLLQRKHENLALEARELVEILGTREPTLPEPRIPDPEAYRKRLAAMGSDIKVNLGCGEKPWEGYINVDLRELQDVDVVADARRLPFQPGSIAELASAHLVEHFREYQLRTRILTHWKGLLRPGGVLRIVCPDWAAMLERLHDGRMPLADFKLLTFGGQDYEGDDHFAMYTPESLRALLLEYGFAPVEVVATDRMNGICPEMELLASLGSP